MNPKCNLTEEELEAAFRQFDGMLSQEEEESIRGLFPQYLFFRNEEPDDSGYSSSARPVRICTCTACRETFEGVRANYARGKIHNEQVTCPHCGKQLEGKAVSKFGYQMTSLHSWIKTAIARPGENGALLIEAGDAVRRFNWDDLTGTIEWYPKARYYFARGKTQMWKKHWAACNSFGENIYQFQAEKYINDPFQPNLMGNAFYTGEYSIINLAEALPETDSRYCQIMEFYTYNYGARLENLDTARWMVKYLAWYALQPQIEMAVKLDLMEIVADLVQDGRKNHQFINWNAQRPNEFLRMSKQDARYFLNARMDLNDLKQWKTIGKGMPIGRYLSLAEQCGGTEKLKRIARCAEKAGAGLERAVRYVVGNVPKCGYAGYTIGDIIQYWEDYLTMAQKLDYDLTEETVAMPKDLKQRHDAAAAIIRHQGSEEERKKYIKRKRMLEKKYEFRLGELCILVPQSTEEIVQEGKTLHHCVGGYADRHVRGETTILFLRKRKKQGRSFLTIEMNEYRGKVDILQIHGYKNEGYEKPGKPVLPPLEKYRDFLDTWLAWVNAGSKRDKQGRPILPEMQKEKTA